jgi:hypothetical protein
VLPIVAAPIGPGSAPIYIWARLARGSLFMPELREEREAGLPGQRTLSILLNEALNA